MLALSIQKAAKNFGVVGISFNTWHANNSKCTFFEAGKASTELLLKCDKICSISEAQFPARQTNLTAFRVLIRSHLLVGDVPMLHLKAQIIQHLRSFVVFQKYFHHIEEWQVRRMSFLLFAPSLSLYCLAFSSCLLRTTHLSFVLFENESPRYERLNSRRVMKVIKARWREAKRWLFSQSLSNKRSTRARRNWGSRGYRDDRFHWSLLLLGAARRQKFCS